MEIKYYGVEGASIDGYFTTPDYYVSEILEHKKELLSKAEIKDQQGDIDWIRVTPYENGVVFNLSRQPYAPGPSKYDTYTTASLIISDEEISFVITGAETSPQNRVEVNKEKEQELISKLGPKINIDKINDTKKSSNIFTRRKQAEQEKMQREQYITTMKKSFERLERMLEQKKVVSEGKNKEEQRTPIDIIEYVKNGIENGTLTFEEAQKFQRIVARQGKIGEKVQTILADGTVETDVREVKIDEKTGEPGWIVKNINGPEQYIIEDSTFKKKYEIDPENPEVFKPKGGPMLAAQVNEPLTFAPPMWKGDIQSINAGAYLLMDPTNNQDIYGIGEQEFYNTYAFVNKQNRTR